jgi:stage V sporulation protein B
MDRLQEALGMTEDAARTLKGVYNKTMTLYNLPSSFMVPLTSSVIPAVSAARALKNYKQGALISETTLRTTALLALPAGVGLFALGEPIIRLLYPSTEDVALAGWMLSVLGIASIAVCFMLVSNSIMQAHKLVTLPMVTTLIGCILKLIVGYVLIGNPSVGIKGGAISTVACFGIIALLDLVIIKLALPRSLSYIRVFAKPVAASAAMGASAWAICGLLSGVLVKVGAFQMKGKDDQAILDAAGRAMLSWKGNALAVMVAIGVAVVVYFALVLLTKAISKEDLSLMPKGDKIARLLHIH